MADTDDDPIASWHDRIGTLRKRGRVSGAALAVIPADEIDVRLGRPLPPETLTDEEKGLWQRLVDSRRPQWFSGSEPTLESYVTAVSQVRRIEAVLRNTEPGTGERYTKLARLHRQSVALTASLATKLRLVPSSRLDRRTPQDGELPVG